MTEIERAVEVAGSQSELARRIGVRQQTVNGWVRDGAAPAKWIDAIFQATKGRVARKRLLDDVIRRHGKHTASA
jgi:DNA-binding transcriptional regulator YdaS (Cro superfamily)